MTDVITALTPFATPLATLISAAVVLAFADFIVHALQGKWD